MMRADMKDTNQAAESLYPRGEMPQRLAGVDVDERQTEGQAWLALMQMKARRWGDTVVLTSAK